MYVYFVHGHVLCTYNWMSKHQMMFRASNDTEYAPNSQQVLIQEECPDGLVRPVFVIIVESKRWGKRAPHKIRSPQLKMLQGILPDNVGLHRGKHLYSISLGRRHSVHS